MDRLTIEFITALGMPPVEYVNLAADLGCRYVGLGLAPITANPHNFPTWSLMNDAALRRNTIAAMRDRGVSLSVGEGIWVMPDKDVRDHAPAALDALCELGTPRINTLSFGGEVSRAFDQFATLVEMADARGVETTLEFVPVTGVKDLPTALAAVRHVGRPTFRVLIDTMHLVRSGSGASDIAALDPNLIGYSQLCDVPRAFTLEGYGEEATHERMVPGTGDLPLPEILKALPRDILVGLEVPRLSVAKAGMDLKTSIGQSVEAARKMMAEAGV